MVRVRAKGERCYFIGGPLDGEHRRIPESWTVVRITSSVVPYINIGIDEIAGHANHIYLRDEDGSSLFIYGGLE